MKGRTLAIIQNILLLVVALVCTVVHIAGATMVAGFLTPVVGSVAAIIASLILALVLLPVPLYVFSVAASVTGYFVVRERLSKLTIPEADLNASRRFMKTALLRELPLRLFDSLLVWYAVPIALIGLRETATKLPKWASVFDNNVGLNGDGELVLRDGVWVHLRDIGRVVFPGEELSNYNDLRYTGYAYYKFFGFKVKPRSYFGRLAWLWRNRASQASVNVGIDILRTDPIQVISGSHLIDRINNPGHFLMRALSTEGPVYHYKEFVKTGFLAIIRSYGCKLEYNFYHPTPETYKKVPVVAVGWSAKKWGG